MDRVSTSLKRWLPRSAPGYLDACRYLEIKAPRILKEKRVSSSTLPCGCGRPGGIGDRNLLGVRVLVLAPSNYPLMLPGIQTLQAVAAAMR